MTAHESALLGWTLIAVAIVWTVWAICALLLNHRREARSEAEWRAWFAALPESQKRAGAERLLEAVRDEGRSS